MKKRILVVAPDFFNYYRLICHSLEESGWEVVYLPDRPPVGSLGKIGIRKARSLFAPYLNAFYKAKIEELGRFDRILIIKGEGITEQTMSVLRTNSPGAKITLYLWDGIRNVPGGQSLSRLVDDVFTFDPEDAKVFGFKLQPLFYVAASEKIEVKVPRFLVSFVGSIHSDRLKVISAVRKALRHRDDLYVFVYFPSKIIFYFRKFFDPSFRLFSPGELTLKSISKDAVEDVFRSSRAVLDIQHPKQTGLTMRTLETLALGKKLITTNQTVVQYPFYNAKNICVIDRQNPVVPEEFFNSEVDQASVDLVKSYELQCWVNSVIGS